MNQLLSVVDHESSANKKLPMSEEEKRKQTAHQLIIDNTFNAALMGLVPILLLDSLLVGVVQLKMISELCLVYEIRFTDHLGKAVLMSLVGGIMTAILGSLTGTFLHLNWLRTVGREVGIGVAGGAVTYAVGRVFWQHLESGGNLLDFKAKTKESKESKEYFTQMYEEGKQVVGAGAH